MSRLLVVRNTHAIREVARAAAATLAAAYPARTADAVGGPSRRRAVARVRDRLDAPRTGGVATLLDGPPRGVGLGR